MSRPNRRIIEIAARFYDNALDRASSGAPVDIDLVKEQVAAALSDNALAEDILKHAASSAVDSVDKTRTMPPQSESLFDSLDQAVPVAPKQRLLRRQMLLADWTAHLGYVSENAARVNASAARENRRFTALAPFLAEGVSTDAAVKAWQEAHPGEVLP
jgi:hypothetical protein